MKSLDMTNEQIKISFPKKTLNKNSSSSSQMNIRSSKKLLMVSNSHKNSDLFSKKLKKVSTESGQSFSIQKIGLNQSIKYSNKKILKHIKKDMSKEFLYKRTKGKGNKSETGNRLNIKKTHKKVPSSSQHKYENEINFLGT
jgi:hypothetical protein